MGSLLGTGAGGRGALLCAAKCALFYYSFFLSSLEVVLGGRLVRLRPRDTRDSHRERCRKFVFAPDCRGIQSKRSGGGGPFLLKMRLQEQGPMKEMREAEQILSF